MAVAIQRRLQVHGTNLKALMPPHDCLSSPAQLSNCLLFPFVMGKKNQLSLEGHVSGQANTPLSRPAHALSYSRVIEEVGCDGEEGLTTAGAQERHKKYGNNDLGEGGKVSPGKILLRQVANAMTLVRSATAYSYRFLLTCY